MIKRLLSAIYDRFRPVRINGNLNSFERHSPIGKGFLCVISGNNNKVIIGKNCLLTNTRIQIGGGNNQVIIEDNARFIGPCKIIIEGENSVLHIGNNAGIRGVEFNLNGARIDVGELCMFSYGIILRNHDSHKIFDLNHTTILNPPKDIILGKHVWVGQDAKILKGCHIGDDSIIGLGAVVTKSCKAGSVMTGVPARVVKENITWDY